MDVYSYNTLSIVPRLDDLVIDPFTVGGLGTDEHNCARSARHLIRNPSLDGGIATLLDGFPVIVGSGLVAFNRANVSNL